MLDGDLGLSTRQPHNQGLTCGSKLGASTLPPALPSGGRRAPLPPQSLHTSCLQVPIATLVPCSVLLLPFWAGTRFPHELSPPSLSWAKAKEFTVVPFATVLKSSTGGRRAGLLAALAPTCSQMPIPGYLGQGGCPWVAFWVLHVGGGDGHPSLTSWGTLSSLLCCHPEPSPQGSAPAPSALA